MSKFSPLHIRSAYSLLSSGLTIEKIIKNVINKDYFGAAINDINTMYGEALFAKMMEENNKPYLLSFECILLNYHVVIFSLSEIGYSLLCSYSSSINKGNDIFNNLKENHQDLVGVLITKEEQFILDFKNKNVDEKIKTFFSLFDDFYLGLDFASREDIPLVNSLRDFVKEKNYKLIAFPLICYEVKNDAIILEILSAIKEKKQIEIVNEKEGNLFFRSNNDYYKIYKQEEIDYANKLVSSSKFYFAQKRGEMLHYPIENAKDYLSFLVFSSLKNKNKDDEKHINRAKYELEVISKLNYNDYFLLVYDYVNYAKSHDILVGPGRGSASGSLVSYALNITEIDPLDYHLLFDRFLNEARKNMPDIDTDFMDTKRNEVINYLKEKWGNNKVAGIITFQTIGAKQAIRDIVSIQKKLNVNFADTLCKAIGNSHDDLKTNALKNQIFIDILKSDKTYENIFSLAQKIEGLPRQKGLHASGIVLNNMPFDDKLPIITDINNDYITQYEMHAVEEQGFLKMDILGNHNLTIISECVDLINLNHKDIHLDKNNLPYENLEAIELIKDGLTMGLFQLESPGMISTIKLLKPKKFTDIALLIAIFRPGPMDNIKEFIKRKNDEKNIKYLSKNVEKVLKDTYGILIYQEQISELAMVMASFTPSEADVFRSAVSKKVKSLLESQKEEFIFRSIKNGYRKEDVINMYNNILKFANYGFNKSHAVVYAMIASRMAYLKKFYPLEFFSTILNYPAGDSANKINTYILEMKKFNIKVLYPDINIAINKYYIVDSNIMYPLSEVKGINDIIYKGIIKERQNSPFKDIFDFLLRMHPYKISFDQVNYLIDAGAFDSFNINRASLKNSLFKISEYVELCFDINGKILELDDIIKKPQIINVDDNPKEKSLLEFEAIKLLIGENPLIFKKDLLKKKNVIEIANAKERVYKINELQKEKNINKDINFHCNVSGIISSLETKIIRKNNKKMAFLTIFDETSDLKVIIFPDLYEKVYNKLTVNVLVILYGIMEYKDEKISFIAKALEVLED